MSLAENGTTSRDPGAADAESAAAALVRRGVPADLHRGVTPQITEESMRRYLATQERVPGGVLPVLPQPAAGTLASGDTITLQDVELVGSSILGTKVEPLIAAVRGQRVAPEDVLKLKNRINQLFVTEGYINSGVMVPDQQVRNGVVRFNVVEGQVGHVNVNSRLRHNYITRRIETGKPFNLAVLQASLKLLEKDPLVSRIHARILPGSEVGLADINLDVDTPRFYRVGIGVGNDRSPSIGSEHGQVWFASDNLTNHGDALYLSASFTEGLSGQSGSYSLPFNRWDHEISFAHSVSDSTVIEEPFTAVDIDSETEATKIGLRFPLRRNLTGEWALEIAYEQRRNFTTLLGLPYSFSDGAVNGESRVAPVRLGIAYVHQGLSQSFAGRVVASVGTSSYDSTQHRDRPDGDFTTLLAQMQYSRQLGGGFHGTAKVLAQRADDALLAIERVALGGMGTVRGYRQNQLVRDNVLLVSLEARYRLPFEAARLDFVTFYDWGSGKNDSAASSSKRDSLSGLGVGLSLASTGGLRADVYWAHAFEDIPVRDKDLQDRGVHLKVSYEYRF